MDVCHEMQKLRNWLDAHGIQWHDASEDISRPEYAWWICRTHFKIGKEQWSVINGHGTYGGIDYLTGVNAGLLEIMGPHMHESVTGHLTASAVEAILRRSIKRNKNA